MEGNCPPTPCSCLSHSSTVETIRADAARTNFTQRLCGFPAQMATGTTTGRDGQDQTTESPKLPSAGAFTIAMLSVTLIHDHLEGAAPPNKAQKRGIHKGSICVARCGRRCGLNGWSPPRTRWIPTTVPKVGRDHDSPNSISQCGLKETSPLLLKPFALPERKGPTAASEL